MTAPDARSYRSLTLPLATALAGGLLLVSPLGSGFANFSYDLPFSMGFAATPDEAVVVYMDEESRVELRQSATQDWDRRLHTRLIRELTARHAKVIVFDVLFDHSSEDRSVDDDLAAAMKAHGRVVVAADLRYSANAGQPPAAKALRAIEPISAVTRWGVDQLPVDTDGAIRGMFQDADYASLAGQAALLFSNAPPDAPVRGWIRYYSHGEVIPRVSYHQALATNGLPAGFFENKAVFVGQEPTSGHLQGRGGDAYRTAESRWSGYAMPGVAIHATAFLNLVRGEWLTRLPPIAEFGLVMFLGWGFGWGMSMLRPRPAVCVGLLGIVGVPLVALLAVSAGRTWFSWAVVSGAQIPLAMIWSLARRAGPQLKAAPSLEATPTDRPAIPDHTLLRCIGEGSYGKVWLARSVMGTYRAVKVVFRDRFESDAPFDREFSGIKNFEPHSRSHEGFVDILHVGRNDAAGFFFCVMEIADDAVLGQQINPDTYAPRTLSRELAKHERLPSGECLKIALFLSSALARLHEEGLVHRDIKPSNIVYVQGVPKLADIGLVADVREAKSYVGTAGFIPPEGPGTTQADIYSLGKVLYEISMGMDRRLFPEVPYDLGEGPLDETLKDLNSVILKACARAPSKRYRSAQRMYEDLLGLSEKGKTPATRRPKNG
ncbi:MAG: CHASE2 domain-containing protein [Verrucomicrobia bacterium]|nr:CHASE2 domain-containing protein [Verrucomicrobiota bacterium]